MASWSEWMNVGTDFEDLTIGTVSGRATVYGGGDVANSTRIGQTTTYTVTKSGKATLLFGSYVTAQVGGFGHKSTVIYHNGVALSVTSPATIDVTKGDTLYAKGTFGVGSSTTTSHIGVAHVVLNVIEHD